MPESWKESTGPSESTRKTAMFRVDSEAAPAPAALRHADVLISKRRYRRQLITSVLSVLVVSVVPLVILTVINDHQYRTALHEESIGPIARLTENAELSLETYLSQRVSALSLVVLSEPLEDLREPKRLHALLVNMRRTVGGFVDLGVVDSNGVQVSYAGPYELLGKSYEEQAWWHQVRSRGVHVSQVFLGHRHLPHFVIAVSHDAADAHSSFVLRATIDTDAIARQIRAIAAQHATDAFIINHAGVLQTPSRLYGKTLERYPRPVPSERPGTEVLELTDESGRLLLIGYAYVKESPFVVMIAHRPSAAKLGGAGLRGTLLVFLSISILLISGVAFWGSYVMVNRARQADLRRAAVFHKMEYTNKMAAIGRLAAGVAHEINNPLAIINQKAGLLKDLFSLREDMPPKDKVLRLVDSVLESVDRCGTITHRLLGFAKHMDVQREGIDLELLLKGVLGFLEKEATYRRLTVNMHTDDDVPTIVSDRGQLQQVFLNIVNNAFAAVDEGGEVGIHIGMRDPTHVAVEVKDNGKGIAEKNLERIFEPFYTTKKGEGTGLGLSITYGIVQKLGGRIKVASKVGHGTRFTVTLPVGRS